MSRLQGDRTDEMGPRVSVYAVKDQEYLESLLKHKVKFHVPPDFVTVWVFATDGAPDPHSDGFPTALNYYVSTPPAITMFWDEIENKEPDDWPIVKTNAEAVWQAKPSVYDRKNLKLASSFRAVTNDAYLLNVSRPHSLNKHNNGQNRVILRWMWKTASFDDVLNGIEILSQS